MLLPFFFVLCGRFPQKASELRRMRALRIVRKARILAQALFGAGACRAERG